MSIQASDGTEFGGERQAPPRALGASAGRKRAFAAPRTVCTRAMTFTPRLGATPTLTKGCPHGCYGNAGGWELAGPLRGRGAPLAARTWRTLSYTAHLL